MKRKENRLNNKLNDLPENYSNGLIFLDVMYADPVYIRNTNKPKKTVSNNSKKAVSNNKSTDIPPVAKQFNNNQINRDSYYDLPGTLNTSPLSPKYLVFYIIFGLVLTIVFGFILIAIFGNYHSFDIWTIVQDLLGNGTQQADTVSNILRNNL